MYWFKIYDSVVEHLNRLLQTLGGWCILAFSLVVNFLCGYSLAFAGVITCVVFDAIFGIASALKQGKFARSELLRDTVSKVGAYGSALVVFAFVEKLIGMSMPYCVNVLAAIICATELLSIAGNVLIVNPHIVFFKLLIPALRGEIANKLHIKESDVDEALKLMEIERELKKEKQEEKKED